MAIIKFKLNGVDRIIKTDSVSYIAMVGPTESVKNEIVLGYYSTLGNAILKHIKHAAMSSESEEVVSLKEVVAKIEDMYNYFRSIKSESDIPESSVIDKKQQKEDDSENKDADESYIF